MILHRLQGLCTTMPGMVFSAAPQLAQSLREGVAAALSPSPSVLLRSLLLPLSSSTSSVLLLLKKIDSS